MQNKNNNHTLCEIRDQIDHLDIEIVKLLKKRTEQVLISRRFKQVTEDKSREIKVLETVTRCADSILDRDFLQKLFVKIITESKNQQEKQTVLAGFSGEHGAYSEVALLKWNHDWIALPQPDIDKLLQQTFDGIFDYAVIALESTQGGVDRLINSLLADCGLYINGAVDLQINHCLLTLPQTSYRDIKSVYSHPQAINQCREFIKRHNLQVYITHDTGMAASFLAEKQFDNTGVIASKETASLYNLAIIKENIQDRKINRTRFLVMSRDKKETIPGKCSVLFDLKTDNLAEAVHDLSSEQFAISRLESFSNQNSGLTIFADVMIDNAPSYDRLIRFLSSDKYLNFKVLGCYQEIKV